MTKYLLAGGVIVLLLAGFAYSRSAGEDSPDLSPQQSFHHSHGMAVDATDPTKLYIATHEGLYLLENEKDLYHVGTSRDDLMGFVAHPNIGGAFFSSGHPERGGNIGFQFTIDGGLSWKKVSDGLGGPVDFHSMTVSQVSPDIVYGFFRGLQRSIDGGKTWELAKGEIAPISLSTDPKQELVVYAATQNGVMTSADRGDSWKSLSEQLEGGVVSVFAISPDASYALTFSERLRGLGKSTDGGATWSTIAESFGNSPVLYLAFNKAGSAVYALTERNSIYKSSDAGATWSQVH